MHNSKYFFDKVLRNSKKRPIFAAARHEKAIQNYIAKYSKTLKIQFIMNSHKMLNYLTALDALTNCLFAHFERRGELDSLISRKHGATIRIILEREKRTIDAALNMLNK